MSLQIPVEYLYYGKLWMYYSSVIRNGDQYVTMDVYRTLKLNQDHYHPVMHALQDIARQKLKMYGIDHNFVY
jgi:hypothetical protein